MRSTFMGLETSKRGLFTQQSALYTTGHNIANANTEGYSRQRVNMEPTQGYPGMGLNAPTTPGFIGTGVQAGSVQRIRDEFIDRQYRQETNKLGYWESRSNAISQMEDVLSEPSKYGLDEAFRMFWSALQDVSANPEDASARKVAIQRAQHVADSFNYIDTQLKQIQGNLGNEISVSVTQINSILNQIADINKQIQAVEPNGYVPNDLYDQRDLLVDELNEYLPVSIERVPSGGNASEVAEGSYTITYKKSDGTSLTLVEGRKYVALTAVGENDTEINGDVFAAFTGLKISSLDEPPKKVDADKVADKTISYNDFEQSKGKLLSLIDSYGYVGATGVEGYYPNMLSELDKLAEVFATAFNEQHRNGYTLDTDKEGTYFFLGKDADLASASPYPGKITAASIKVNDDIINNPSLVAASTEKNEEGNGKNALALAALQSQSITTVKIMNSDGTNTELGLDGATFQSFYKGLIGELGVDGEKATLLKTNSETIRLTVQNNRAAMSSVSLDEEMTDMIRFQQAYNASARMITVVDETLDKIINGMGRVGL